MQAAVASLAMPTAFLLAFSNGANDIANSMGTIVGAGTMTMRQALVFGSAFEFVGAMAIGPFVASSIAGGQLHTSVFDDDPTLFALVMLSALSGAGGTTLLATLYGYPISATHGVISGIIAVALCTGRPGALDTSGFGQTLFGWVASPVVGMLAGVLVSLAIDRLVISAPNPAAAAAASQPILLTLTAAISFLFLLLKGPPLVTTWVNKRYWLALTLALLGGLAVAALRGLVAQALRKDRARLARLYETPYAEGSSAKCELVGVSSSSSYPPTSPIVNDGASERSGEALQPTFDEVQQPFVRRSHTIT